MKQRIVFIALTMLMLLPSVALQAGDKNSKLPQKPYFAMPWTDAFGMKIWQLKEREEIYQGAKSSDDIGIAIYIDFAQEKKFVKEIEYTDTKDNAIVCGRIQSHTYALFPSEAETQGFLFDEIPSDWEMISKEDYKAQTGYNANFMRPIDLRTPFTVKNQCYRLPQVEGKPTVYAVASTLIQPEKKGQYSANGTIVFYPQKKSEKK